MAKIAEARRAQAEVGQLRDDNAWLVAEVERLKAQLAELQGKQADDAPAADDVPDDDAGHGDSWVPDTGSDNAAAADDASPAPAESTRRRGRRA